MVKKQTVHESPKGDMTPMIDMVFQLLIFFILMFKIVIPEGDFAIKMPALGGPADGPPVDSITIQLKADRDGNLTTVSLAGQTFRGTTEGLEQLRTYARKLLGGKAMEAQATEIELVCDYDLKYNNVIRIISDCTGYVDKGKVVKLAEKIKFRPQPKQR